MAVAARGGCGGGTQSDVDPHTPRSCGAAVKAGAGGADGPGVGPPYASRALFFHALNALCIGFIAAYRGGMYGFPTSAWALSAAAGLLGLLAPLGLSARMRGLLLAGRWPLVFVAPVVGLVLSPRLVPSPVTVGPFFFCVGASLTTCVVVLVNTVRRKRSVRCSLESVAAFGAEVRPQLEAYFAAETQLLEGSPSNAKAVQRALRAQAWVSSKRRRAHAAALLREWADVLERTVETEWAIPVLATLFASADDRRASSEQIREAFLSAAVHLENGGRIRRWRRWLMSLSVADVDADRDGVYAIDRLARHHGVPRPGWLRATGRRLARCPLTAIDLTTGWSLAAQMTKALTIVVALVVAASVALSTATAQTPLDDSRRLPVIAGPSAVSHIEPRLSRVASMLAGRRAEVRCWSREDWKQLSVQRTTWPGRARRLGSWSAYASRDHERAHFAPAICASLVRLTYERVPVESDSWPAALAWSVATLAHEAQHLKGVSNEAKAECYGMQSITTATKALGRTEAEGRYLASLYWEDAYPKHRDPAYVSEECREGGRLDLRPRVDVWP